MLVLSIEDHNLGSSTRKTVPGHEAKSDLGHWYEAILRGIIQLTSRNPRTMIHGGQDDEIRRSVFRQVE